MKWMWQVNLPAMRCLHGTDLLLLLLPFHRWCLTPEVFRRRTYPAIPIAIAIARTMIRPLYTRPSILKATASRPRVLTATWEAWPLALRLLPLLLSALVAPHAGAMHHVDE